jgi:hypothetical protein
MTERLDEAILDYVRKAGGVPCTKLETKKLKSASAPPRKTNPARIPTEQAKK